MALPKPLLPPRAIQEALSAWGHYKGEIDGILGRQSEAAINKAFRQRWPIARKLLAVQQKLISELGIEVGAIDGLLGPQTRFAVEAYESLMAVGKLPTWRDPLMEPRPGDRPLHNVWPTQSGVQKFFGSVGKNQTMLKLPYSMIIAWDKKKTVKQFSIHEKVHDSALRVFNRVADAYPESKRKALGLNLFGGCLNVRKMRGGSAYSMHSWGIAIDFDPDHNQLKWGRDRSRLARPDADLFWKLWEEEGWLSLGRTRNFDWMHIQAARL